MPVEDKECKYTTEPETNFKMSKSNSEGVYFIIQANVFNCANL